MKKTKQVLLVDPSPVYSTGLKTILSGHQDLTVAAMVHEVGSALQIARLQTIDLAIIELALTDGLAFDLIRSLRSEHPKMVILILSSQEESVFAERALSLGANGYMMKTEPVDAIITGIRNAIDRGIALSHKQTAALLSKILHQPKVEAQSPVGGLSNRELEVFQLMGHGRTNREIATALYISAKTVESHQAHIRQKLGASNRHELMRMAFSWLHTQQLHEPSQRSSPE